MLEASVILMSLAFVGFVVAFYIHHKQASGEHLVCYIGQNCGNVINSKYAYFLGVSNTTWGMIYFGAIFAAYAAGIVFPAILIPTFLTAMLILSGSAALFSTYLILVQLLIIHDWCEWCLVAATISYLIFITSLL